MQLATDRAIVLQYRDAFFAVIISASSASPSVPCLAFALVKSVTQPINRHGAGCAQDQGGSPRYPVSGQLTGELDMLKNGINATAKALSEYHEEMQQNIDQATSGSARDARSR